MATEQRKDMTPDDNKMHVTSVLAQQHEHAILDQDATSDEQTLGALGYKQEFKRCGHGYELVPLPRHSAIPQPQNIQPHFPLYRDVPSVCIPLGEHALADCLLQEISLCSSHSRCHSLCSVCFHQSPRLLAIPLATAARAAPSGAGSSRVSSFSALPLAWPSCAPACRPQEVSTMLRLCLHPRAGIRWRAGSLVGRTSADS